MNGNVKHATDAAALEPALVYTFQFSSMISSLGRGEHSCTDCNHQCRDKHAIVMELEVRVPYDSTRSESACVDMCCGKGNVSIRQNLTLAPATADAPFGC